MAKKKRRRDPAARIFKELEERLAAGDGYALLTAVDLCVRTGRPVPPPFAQAFCDRLDEWFRYRMRSLDQAFTVQRPQRQHFDKLKERSRLRPIVVVRILQLHQRHNLKIDAALFGRVAKELKISLSTASRLYYDKEGQALRRILRNASFSEFSETD
jgi:hypothetical protein